MSRPTLALAAAAGTFLPLTYSFLSRSSRSSPPDFDLDHSPLSPPPSPLATSSDSKSPLLVPIRCVDGTMVVPYKLPPRSSQLQRLKSEHFDVLVIGGGAVGCGVALDAATRGLKVALVERDDFSAGTSSRSTKLIHGGIRYLENAFKNLDPVEYELVKEALEERRHMLQAAPYMNQPLPIMIPLYWRKWWDIFLVPYYIAGAKVYDFVGNLNSDTKVVPSSHFIDKDEAKYQFPMLKDADLLGAIVYYDGQMNDARMGLHLALTATQSGAAVASRVSVNGLIHDPSTKRCVGANVTDVMSGESFSVNARIVVNATGPFADAVRRMDDKDAKDIIKGAAGVHVVLPDHYSPAKMGLIIPNTSDGRVLFFLPWEGATIAGTTDSASDLTMTPSPSDSEVGFILEEANKYLQKTVSSRDVMAAWSGIRPLVYDVKKGTDTKSISRQHVIEVSEAGKLVTIAGGKWTTYRRMAQDTVDLILRDFPKVAHGRALRPTSTMGRGIIGADRSGIVTNGKFDRVSITLRDEYGLPKDVAKHLVANYGTRALQIAELVKIGGVICEKEVMHPVYGAKRINSKYPFLEAEVVFAVRHDYALTAIDVLARRMRLAFIDCDAADQAVERVVELMAPELKWDRARKKDEIAKTKQWLKTMHLDDRDF